VPDLYSVLARFLGTGTADGVFHGYAAARGLRWPTDTLVADAELVHQVEVQLAGAIGAASARIMVGSVVKEEALSIEEVREILDEASQVVVYSHRLQQKSRELEAATAELRQEKNIGGEARLPERVSSLTVDLDRMIQVMLNLLSNAVKFCDGLNGRVEIALSERDGSLRVDVCDNGRGIGAENHVAIFSKFHQVGNTLTDKPHGSGLGLHISRQI